MVYGRKQSKKIDMSKASIVKRRDDVLLKICIEHVMQFCESVICSVLCWLVLAWRLMRRSGE